MSRAGVAALIALALVAIGGTAPLTLAARGGADTKGVAMGLVWAGFMFALLALVFVWAEHMG